MLATSASEPASASASATATASASASASATAAASASPAPAAAASASSAPAADADGATSACSVASAAADLSRGVLGRRRPLQRGPVLRRCVKTHVVRLFWHWWHGFPPVHPRLLLLREEGTNSRRGLSTTSRGGGGGRKGGVVVDMLRFAPKMADCSQMREAAGTSAHGILAARPLVVLLRYVTRQRYRCHHAALLLATARKGAACSDYSNFFTVQQMPQQRCRASL